MAYTEQEARHLVVEAGHRLVEAGLIARTWGNISARISDTQFVITPSGLAYETLLPAQLVTVNMADCSHEGDRKPSSEKGIHADAYLARPEVQFVIHTHQDKASVVSVAASDLEKAPARLGGCVPCAGYGMPSTKTLRRAVETAAALFPECPAILMQNHGALCMGESFEDAFAVSQALEDFCAALVPPRRTVKPTADCGESARNGALFTWNGFDYAIDGADLPPDAAIHAAIYRTTDATYILPESDPDVSVVSASGKTLRPLLEDLVQIAGQTVRNAPAEDPLAVAAALKGRNAVLVRGRGALCTGKTVSDADAARILLRKDCEAQRFAAGRQVHKLGGLDAWFQRQFYLFKYAKRKDATC